MRGEFDRIILNRSGVSAVLPSKPELRGSTMKSIFSIAALLAGTFVQAQTGEIVGRLLNQEQKPASGVRVSVITIPDSGTTTPVAPTLVRSAVTDGEGKYRLDEIPPGRYYVTAGLVDFPTYYPGTALISGATVVSVGAGSLLKDVDFHTVTAPLSALPAGYRVKSVNRRFDRPHA
jgi:Carboxypeptidase regulatory-like domain